MPIETRHETFEQIIESQSTIIFDYLQKMIENNDVLDDESRKIFFEEYSRGLLGLERKYNFTLILGKDTYTLGNLADWIFKLTFLEETTDKKQELDLKGKKIRVENKTLWLNLRGNLPKPMAEARTLSLTISPESSSREGGAFEFKPTEKITNE